MVFTIPAYLKPAGYEQVTSIGSAKGLSSIPTGVVLAIIQAEAQNIRWRDDGTNPSATVGMILVANDVLMYTGLLSAIKFIEASSGGIVNVSYYRKV